MFGCFERFTFSEHANLYSDEVAQITLFSLCSHVHCNMYLAPFLFACNNEPLHKYEALVQMLIRAKFIELFNLNIRSILFR